MKKFRGGEIVLGAALVCLTNEPGIYPPSEAAESTLNRNGRLTPSESFLRPTCEFGSLFSPLVLSGIWPHSFPRLALKLCMLRGRH